MRWGQRGIAIIAPGVRTIAYLVICLHPPYPVLIVVFVLAGYGNGLEDAAWNVYIGNMYNVNELMGFLHGSYSLGATLSPFIATSLVVKAFLPWYTFYYIMVGLSVFELFGAATAFWTENGPKHRDDHPRSSEKTGSRTREAISSRVVWICSVFLLIYVGIEVSIGGWVVSFMSTVRHASPFAAGMSETGFWAGLTVGRIFLGFVTGRIGERLAILVRTRRTLLKCRILTCFESQALFSHGHKPFMCWNNLLIASTDLSRLFHRSSSSILPNPQHPSLVRGRRS